MRAALFPRGAAADFRFDNHRSGDGARQGDGRAVPAQPTEIPSKIVGVRPIPEPANSENVTRWLQEGKASIGFNGRAIIYHGSNRSLTVDEWVAEFAPVVKRSPAD